MTSKTKGYRQLMVGLETHSHIKALANEWNRPMSSILEMLCHPLVRDVLLLKQVIREIENPDVQRALQLLLNAIARSRQMEDKGLISISVIPKYQDRTTFDEEKVLLFCSDEDMKTESKSLLRYLSI